MSAVFEFILDGFHVRTMDKWREVKSRAEIPARYVPTEYRGNRQIKGHWLAATVVVDRTSPRETAKRHALEYGSAGIWHADDSVTIYTRDGGRVRQRTHKKTRLISNPNR